MKLTQLSDYYQPRIDVYLKCTEAQFTYKPDPVAMEIMHSLESQRVDYSRASEEWG